MTTSMILLNYIFSKQIFGKCFWHWFIFLLEVTELLFILYSIFISNYHSIKSYYMYLDLILLLCVISAPITTARTKTKPFYCSFNLPFCTLKLTITLQTLSKSNTAPANRKQLTHTHPIDSTISPCASSTNKQHAQRAISIPNRILRGAH